MDLELKEQLTLGSLREEKKLEAIQLASTFTLGMRERIGKSPSCWAVSGGGTICGLLGLGQLRGVYAQDVGSLSSSLNFLDSGLAALGSFTAFATTLSRGKLDCETQWRDLTKRHDQIKKYSVKGAPVWCTGKPHELSYSIVGLADYLPYMGNLLCYINRKTTLRGEAVGFQLDTNPSDYCKIFLCKNNMFIETVGDILPGRLADHGSDESVRLLCANCASQNKVPNGFTQRSGEYRKDAIVIQGAGLTTVDEELLQYRYNIFDAFDRVVKSEWKKGHVLIFLHPKKQSNLLNDCFRLNLHSRDENDRGVKQPLQDWLDADDRLYKGQRNSTAVLKSLQVDILMAVEAFLTVTLVLVFRLEILSSSMLSRRVMRNFLLSPSGDSYYLAALSSRVEMVKVSPKHSHIYKCQSALHLPARNLFRQTLAFITMIASLVVWCISIASYGFHWQRPDSYKVRGSVRSWALVATAIVTAIIACVPPVKWRRVTNLKAWFFCLPIVPALACGVFGAYAGLVKAAEKWAESMCLIWFQVYLLFVWYMSASYLDSLRDLNISPPLMWETLSYSMVFMGQIALAAVSGAWK